jgi:hypothetical protein
MPMTAVASLLHVLCCDDDVVLRGSVLISVFFLAVVQVSRVKRSDN